MLYLKVPQPGSGRRRGGGNESDYEEIGPPISRISQRASPSANGSYPASTTGEPNNNFKNEMNSNSTCDLCGTATAIVRCRQCTDQVFCLACDDMYHRHPKRSVHQRKVSQTSPFFSIVAKYFFKCMIYFSFFYTLSFDKSFYRRLMNKYLLLVHLFHQKQINQDQSHLHGKVLEKVRFQIHRSVERHQVKVRFAPMGQMV